MEATVGTSLANPSGTSPASECRKDTDSTKTKNLNFDKEDHAQCGKKTLCSQSKEKIKAVSQIS